MLNPSSPWHDTVIQNDVDRRYAFSEWLRAKFLLILLYTPLVTSTVLSKFSGPKLNDAGLSIGIPITLLVTAMGAVSGAFVLDVPRFILYGVLVSTVCLVQSLGAFTFSAGSMALLIALFAPCALRLRSSHSRGVPLTTNDVLGVLTTYGSFFAAVGILQFFAQFAIGARYAFPIEYFLPSPFLIKSYNYLNALSYGSSIFKSNGLVFLEPSFYSQFLALVLLLEISKGVRALRIWRIMLYLVALAVTFSGTGVIVLAFGLATMVLVERRWWIALASVLLVALAVVFAEPLHIDHQLHRIGEFQSTGSSAFMRFVAWTYMFREYWWGDIANVLVGTGAGSFTAYSAVSTYNASEMSFSKIFFEFGLIGGLLFFGFLFFLIFRTRAPMALKAGMAASLFLNGAYSLQALGLLLTVFVWPVQSEPGAREPTAERMPT